MLFIYGYLYIVNYLYIVIYTMLSSSKRVIIEKLFKVKKPICIDTELYQEVNQKKIIDNIFNGDEFPGIDKIKSIIKKKHTSYKSQDNKKERFIKETFITYEEIIKKLVDSNLKCEYCMCKLLILYINVRESRQWTLDRVDNSMGHTNDNCIISCLQCNLQKRTRDDSKFKFTKQMNIIKIN